MKTPKQKLLLTAPQFCCIADFIRARDPARTAAYMVLVDGNSNQEAMDATGISPASLSNTLTRYRKAAADIVASFQVPTTVRSGEDEDILTVGYKQK